MVIQTPPSSMAGTRRLKAVAASITPAANPSIASSNRSETLVVISTGNAPMPVANPVPMVARKPRAMRLPPKRGLNIRTSYTLR